MFIIVPPEHRKNLPLMFSLNQAPSFLWSRGKISVKLYAIFYPYHGKKESLARTSLTNFEISALLDIPMAF